MANMHFTNAFITGLASVAVTEFQGVSKPSNEVAKSIKKDARWFETSDVDTLGLIPEKTKGGAMLPLTVNEGYTWRKTPVTYAAYLPFTQEDREDDQYGVFMSLAEKLGKSCAETQEVLFWNTNFNNGFATTTTSDGAYVFSATHTWSKGGLSYSNLLTTAVLSPDSLWTAVNAAALATDSGGKLSGNTVNTLWVPQALKSRATEILMSGQFPDDNRNAINAIRNEGIQLKVIPYLTSTTAWFLTGPNSTIYKWERIPATFGTDGDFLTGSSLFSARFRYFTGTQRGYGFYGNAGA